MKNWYYAMSLLLALGLSAAACGERETREEPLSRAPSESVAPPATPQAQEPFTPGSPSGTEEQKDRVEQPSQPGSSS